MTDPVVHFEIPADDLDRARGFYAETFGWTVTSYPGTGYTLLTTAPMGDDGRPAVPGSINGGMLQRQTPVTVPVITVSVEDIDSCLGTIEKLGGNTVRAKWPVGNMGFVAYFSDTEGNVIGLWQTATSP